MAEPQRSAGKSAGKLNTGLSSAQRWIDDMSGMQLRRKQLELEESHAQEQATGRLFMELMEAQMQQEYQQRLQQEAAQQQAQQAQADQQAAGPFQVQVPPESPFGQRPVSFDKPFTQMPSSLDALILSATQGQGAGQALQGPALAAAPAGGGGMVGGAALPPSAAGLPIAGPTQQTRQTTVGAQGQVVEDPFRFLTLMVPSISQTTNETPNELGARDVADLRNQETGLQQQASRDRQAAQSDQVRAAHDFYRDREKLAIDRAQLEINRAEASARMRVAQAQALAAGQKMTPGQIAIDESYKDEWSKQTSGGLSAMAADIGKLKEVASQLHAVTTGQSESNLTGPFIGAVPNRVLGVTNPEAAALRKELESVLQRTAKGTVLDSQYAAQELLDYLAREADTQQEEGVVLNRVMPILSRFEYDFAEAQRKAAYFKANGTLKDSEQAPPPACLANEDLAKAMRTPVPKADPAAQAGADPATVSQPASSYSNQSTDELRARLQQLRGGAGAQPSR